MFIEMKCVQPNTTAIEVSYPVHPMQPIKSVVPVSAPPTNLTSMMMGITANGQGFALLGYLKNVRPANRSPIEKLKYNFYSQLN
jgi:hypothetical protein